MVLFMTVKDEINKVIQDLQLDDNAHINMHGYQVSIKLVDSAHKVSLSTKIYQGSNYIPQSVRSCLVKGLPNHHSEIHTSVSLDEQNFQIRLHYLGKSDHLNPSTFSSLLEEFSWIAEEWRYFLDEHDRHDLIHVHVK